MEENDEIDKTESIASNKQLKQTRNVKLAFYHLYLLRYIFQGFFID